MEKEKERKNIAKAKILEYVLNHESTSKAELSRELNLSMPTVLANVNELISAGIIEEKGEYESTGGRKAKSIGIYKDYCYAIGMDITAHHVGLVLINLGGEIVKTQRIRVKFENDMKYCSRISEIVQAFLNGVDESTKILGLGISLPGIISHKDNMIQKSHALQVENYSLSFLESVLPYPVYFENDANAAMLAENPLKCKNAIYISLNNTLGGAFCIDGKLCMGENHKAGEFGHMILVPGGRNCYCGKIGCADAYCAAGALLNEKDKSLDQVMEHVREKDKEILEKWDAYLDALAMLVTNLRMAYDMDIILGGDVGGYLPEYMMQLGEKVMSYNGFDRELSYLKNCSYNREASAVGAAKHFIYEFVKMSE